MEYDLINDELVQKVSKAVGETYLETGGIRPEFTKEPPVDLALYTKLGLIPPELPSDIYTLTWRLENEKGFQRVIRASFNNQGDITDLVEATPKTLVSD